MAKHHASFSQSDGRLRPTVARVTLWTADAQRLEGFYTRVFGFERAYATTITDPHIVGSWHVPEGSEMQVILMRSPRGETEVGITSLTGQPIATRTTVRDGAPYAGTAYMVIYVPDLDAVLARLTDEEKAFNRTPKRVYDADGRCFYEGAIYDPDGTVLLVVEDVKAPAP
jgi:catechol 2,3-dioxygenase-like lactoylglutathione lyase family enzyme